MKPCPPLRIDDRIGSVELADPLRKRGLPVVVERMEAADLAWESERDGERVVVGVERKRIDDVLTCIRTRRWSDHQLPAMREACDVIVLLIEGIWQAGEDGELKVWRRGGWGHPAVGQRPASMLRSFALTQMFKAGVHVVFSATTTSTLDWLQETYWWWSADGGYARHHSDGGGVYLPQPTIGKLNDVGRMACVIDGLGPTWAVWVQEAFKSPADAMQAGIKRWASIEAVSKKGRKQKLGVKRALVVQDWIHGR